MTVEHIRSKVAEIKESSWDPEGAHSAEDELFRDVLQAIASGTCEDPKGCAAEALTSYALDFPRWCA